MNSLVSVWKQEIEGMQEYYVFLSFGDLEAPANSNPSGFDYTKACIFYACDWYDTGLSVDEFDLYEVNAFRFDESNQHSMEIDAITIDLLANSANIKNIYEFIEEIRNNVECDDFNPKTDAHQPQL